MVYGKNRKSEESIIVKKKIKIKEFENDGLDYILNICEKIESKKTVLSSKKKVKKIKKDLEDLYGRDLKDEIEKNEIEKLNPNASLELKIKGLFNRLSTDNFEFVAFELTELYMQNYSRFEINNIILAVIKVILFSGQKLDYLMLLQISCLIVVVSLKIGIEIGAFFLENIVYLIHNTLIDSNLEEVADKSHLLNILTILCHFSTYKLCNSGIIFEFLTLVSTSLQLNASLVLEIIIHILKTCGISLRKLNPTQFKEFIFFIQSKLDQSNPTINQSKIDRIDDDLSRQRYMIELLLALKNNNLKKLATQITPDILREYNGLIKSTLRNLDSRNGITNPTSYVPFEFDIPYQQLITSHDSNVGKWWIIGAAYMPSNTTQAIDTTNCLDSGCNDESLISKYLGITSQNLSELEKAAEKQGLKTRDRKLLFYIIMAPTASSTISTCENCLKYISDGYNFYLQPSSTRNSSFKNFHSSKRANNSLRIRETFNLILHCCLAESTFNPYYHTLALKLSGTNREFKRFCEFSLSDRLEGLDTMRPHQLNNVIWFTYEMLMCNALSLTVLKKVNFLDLKPNTHKFLTHLISHLLTQSPFLELKENYSDKTEFKSAFEVRSNHVKSMFATLCQTPKYRYIYESLRLFINYMIDVESQSSTQNNLSISAKLENSQLNGKITNHQINRRDQASGKSKKLAKNAEIAMPEKNLNYALIKQRWALVEDVVERF